MLKPNTEAIKDFRRLGRNSKSEIIIKLTNSFNCSKRTVEKRLEDANFTVDERLVFDEICKPYFDIMPEVLQNEIMEEKVPEL